MANAEIVFTNKTPISKEDMMACPNLKYIGVLASGYNVVDVHSAKELGIPVSNIPTYGTDAVSQYVFALLLEVCHNVKAHDQAVKAGQWTSSKDFCFWNHPLMELSGLTMGIIGTGKIGLRTAEIAKAFNMNVIAYSRRQSEEHINYVALEDLFKQSDVISLHCPLNDETYQIINEDSIAMMKSNVILINTARGPLVDESALVAALNSDKIKAYATDVLSVEPMPENHILLSTKNCLITPHIAWAPFEARQRLMDIAVNNLESYLNNKAMNIVNE